MLTDETVGSCVNKGYFLGKVVSERYVVEVKTAELMYVFFPGTKTKSKENRILSMNKQVK